MHMKMMPLMAKAQVNFKVSFEGELQMLNYELMFRVYSVQGALKQFGFLFYLSKNTKWCVGSVWKLQYIKAVSLPSYIKNKTPQNGQDKFCLPMIHHMQIPQLHQFFLTIIYISKLINHLRKQQENQTYKYVCRYILSLNEKQLKKTALWSLACILKLVKTFHGGWEKERCD